MDVSLILDRLGPGIVFLVVLFGFYLLVKAFLSE